MIEDTIAIHADMNRAQLSRFPCYLLTIVALCCTDISVPCRQDLVILMNTLMESWLLNYENLSRFFRHPNHNISTYCSVSHNSAPFGIYNTMHIIVLHTLNGIHNNIG